MVGCEMCENQMGDPNNQSNAKGMWFAKVPSGLGLDQMLKKDQRLKSL
jgi:hypothetical protein